MALSQVQSVTKSTYINTAAGYSIQYTISQDEGQNAQMVDARIKKADVAFGYASVDKDGNRNISLKTGIADADAVSIITTVFEDAKSIFTQRNKQ